MLFVVSLRQAKLISYTDPIEVSYRKGRIRLHRSIQVDAVAKRLRLRPIGSLQMCRGELCSSFLCTTCLGKTSA